MNPTPDPLAAWRPRFGWWRGKFFVSACLVGYGLSLGVTWRRQMWIDWLPIRVFRNYAYRGLR